MTSKKEEDTSRKNQEMLLRECLQRDVARIAARLGIIESDQIEDDEPQDGSTYEDPHDLDESQ